MATENKGGIDYVAVLADLKAKNVAIEESIKWIEAMIRGNVPSGATGTTGSAHAGHSNNSPVALKEHTFFDMTVVDATKLYLSMTPGEPKSTQEITDALKDHGLPNTKLSSVTQLLSRSVNTTKDIKKLPGKKWGLAVWFDKSRA